MKLNKLRTQANEKGFTLMELMIVIAIIGILAAVAIPNFIEYKNKSKTASIKTSAAVARQQTQYSDSQPIPAYDWSLERDLLIQLYNIRNMKALTHSVWRSDYGSIEGDCASIGFGIPYDSSLTNPLVATDIDMQGDEHSYQGGALASIEQPEPNGIFASKNTSATWVMCAGDTGMIEPVYIETKVTVYPYSVSVSYAENRVTKTGKASVTLKQ